MSKKLYDLSVKVGEGTSGAYWENIGVVMESDDPSKPPYLLLKRTFNPAGVPGNNRSVIVSCFEPKAKDEAAQMKAPGI